MKNLPIGKSDFRQIREAGDYYIDKSLFIEELMEHDARSFQILRPRLFGKTLNLSMLKYFFNVNQAEENKKLFQGLAIEKSEAWNHQGRYPVIFLSFLGLNQPSFDGMLEVLRRKLQVCAENFGYLLSSDLLDDADKAYLNLIISGEAHQAQLQKFLRYVTAFLNKHHGIAPVVLVDVIDAPFLEAHENNYFSEMLDFMQGFLSAGFVDNENLTKCVMTGILPVARKGELCSVFNSQFSACCGFTREEVDQLLVDAVSLASREDIASWYNGYSFGGESQIYNPWAILNFVAHLQDGLIPYWVNTSSNDLIKEILPKADKSTQDLLFDLLEGNTVEAEVEDSMVFEELFDGKSDMVLGLLLFSGYLTTESYSETRKKKLRIPNLEIRQMYERILKYYLQSSETVSQGGILQPLLEQRPQTFANALSAYLTTSFSFFDIGKKGEPEKIYHAFMLGLIAHLNEDYHIRSNREVGFGRADLIIYPKDPSNPKGWVLEFKKKDADDKGTLEELAEDALAQIKKQNYLDEIQAHGHDQILCMGVAFDGKEAACAF